MRVGFVGEVRTGSTAGVARSTVLRLGLVVVVVAGLHLVVVTERSVRAVLVGSTTEELLAIRSAVLVVAASALRLAAADGEHPEKTSSDGESGGNRDAGEEAAVDITLDTVELGCALDSTNNCTSKDTRKYDSGDNESGCNTSDDPCQAGEDARAVGEDTENNLSSKGDESCDVDDLSPLGDSLEGLESTLNLIRELNLEILVGTDEIRGVQLLVGPVKLGLLALSLAIRVGLAETPEVDVVVLVETEQLSGNVILDLVGTLLDHRHIAGIQLEVLEVEVIDNVADIGRADAEVLDINSEDVERLVGDTSEGTDE